MNTVFATEIPQTNEIWDERDRDYLAQEKSLDRIRTTKYHFKYPLSFYIIGNSSFKRKAPRVELEELHSLGLPKKPVPNEVRVVLLNNITVKSNWKPLTPWIIMHRLFHSIENSSIEERAEFNRILRPFDELVGEFQEFLYNRIMNLGKTSLNITQGIDKSWEIRASRGVSTKEEFMAKSVNAWSIMSDEYVPAGLRDLLTMRSARENRLQPGDTCPELWTQYVVTGKIVFRQMPYATTEQYEKFCSYIPALEAAFDELQDFMCGKTFVF